jgi:hypothetical protein
MKTIIERFKEVTKRYQKFLNDRLRLLEGAPETVIARILEDYETQLMGVVGTIEIPGNEENQETCNEITQIVQNELFPFALAYWTLLYCEKTKTQ